MSTDPVQRIIYWAERLVTAKLRWEEAQARRELTRALAEYRRLRG